MCSVFRLTGLILSDAGWGVLTQEKPRRSDPFWVKVDEETQTCSASTAVSRTHLSAPQV